MYKYSPIIMYRSCVCRKTCRYTQSVYFSPSLRLKRQPYGLIFGFSDLCRSTLCLRDCLIAGLRSSSHPARAAYPQFTIALQAVDTDCVIRREQSRSGTQNDIVELVADEREKILQLCPRYCKRTPPILDCCAASVSCCGINI